MGVTVKERKPQNCDRRTIFNHPHDMVTPQSNRILPRSRIDMHTAGENDQTLTTVSREIQIEQFVSLLLRIAEKSAKRVKQQERGEIS